MVAAAQRLHLCGGGEASRADIVAASPSSFCWLTMSGMSCMRDRSAIAHLSSHIMK
jgi:hypothetical protein